MEELLCAEPWGYSPFTPWKETAGIFFFFENSGQENRTSKFGIHEATHEGLDYWEGRAGPSLRRECGRCSVPVCF